MTGDREMVVLLARIDARMGSWVQVHDLAQHIGCTDDTARVLLERAESNGYVRLARGMAEGGNGNGVFAAASILQPAPLAEIA